MDFTPETEEEIDKALTLAEGVYDFEVSTATDKLSSKGNPMIAVVLRVFAPDGTKRLVNDWLLPAPALSKKKLARFCRSVGLTAEYDAGKVSAADCEGRAGKVVLKHETTEQYGTQLRVDTYDPATGAKPRPVASPAAAATPAPIPADCPF
jgi:hypothetical protein